MILAGTMKDEHKLKQIDRPVLNASHIKLNDQQIASDVIAACIHNQLIMSNRDWKLNGTLNVPSNVNYHNNPRIITDINSDRSLLFVRLSA